MAYQNQSLLVEQNTPNKKKNIKTIVLSLDCLQEGCETKVSSQKQLDDHLWDAHRMHRFRCPVSGCESPQTCRSDIISHVRENHPLDVWNCAICPSKCIHFEGYLGHIFEKHQFGHFQCGFEGCGFTGSTRGIVSLHKQIHRDQTKKFVCSYVTCTQCFNSVYHLKCHERTHSRMKPYKCTWLNCEYSSNHRGTMVSHIRAIHFKIPRTLKEQNSLNIANDRDSNLYIQLNPDLL